MSSPLPQRNPVASVGINEILVPGLHYDTRSPTTHDYYNFKLGDIWINRVSEDVYMLVRQLQGVATWILLGSLATPDIHQLTPDIGAPVVATAGNVNVNGVALQGVQTANAGVSTLSITVADATTASKGVAEFNPADFTVVGGIVSLISHLIWVNVVASPQAMAANRGYSINTAGLCTLTLPMANCNFGDTIWVSGLGAGGWTINQAAGQSVIVGNQSTTVGVGGTLSSGNRYDSVLLLCVTANTTFKALHISGNLLLA